MAPRVPFKGAPTAHAAKHTSHEHSHQRHGRSPSHVLSCIEHTEYPYSMPNAFHTNQQAYCQHDTHDWDGSWLLSSSPSCSSMHPTPCIRHHRLADTSPQITGAMCSFLHRHLQGSRMHRMLPSQGVSRDASGTTTHHSPITSTISMIHTVHS